MFRKALAVMIIAGGAVACSSPVPVTHAVAPVAVTSRSAVPFNPVTILRKIGASIPAGVRYGQTDIYGDRYASGGGAPNTCGGPCEDITVYTFADAAAQQADIKRNDTPSDANATVAGHLFNVHVTGFQNLDGSFSFGSITLQMIAARVHGTVVSK